jgi:hypothetical protein
VTAPLDKLPTILVLAVLVGIFVSLRKHTPSARVRLWAYAWDEARRMKRIVDGLLRFARRKNAAERSDRLEAALHDVTQLRECHLRKLGIGTEFDLEPDLPAFAIGEGELKQVLLNLLNNAVDAVGRRRDTRNPPLSFAPERARQGRDRRFRARLLGLESCVRSLLHDEASWQGNGLGAEHLLRHRPRMRRRSPFGEQGTARRARAPGIPDCRANSAAACLVSSLLWSGRTRARIRNCACAMPLTCCATASENRSGKACRAGRG